MKAKQNLEKIQEFETLIIYSPNCNDTIVMSLTDRLHFCIYRNTNPALVSNKITNLVEYSAIERPVEFTNKMYIIANEKQLKKSTLFCIEESGESLTIKQVKSKQSEQNTDLLTK